MSVMSYVRERKCLVTTTDYCIGDVLLLTNGYVGTVKSKGMRHRTFEFLLELHQKHPNGGSNCGVKNELQCEKERGFFVSHEEIKAKLDMNSITEINNIPTLTVPTVNHCVDIIHFPSFSELKCMHKITSAYLTFGYSRDIGTHVPTSILELCLRYNSYQPFINDTVKLIDGQIGRIWCIGKSNITNTLYFGITLNNAPPQINVLSQFHTFYDISKVFEYDAIKGHGLSDLSIGQSVVLSSNRAGIIKYTGQVHDVPCVGVELINVMAWEPRNVHDGKGYFKCDTNQPKSGLFVCCNDVKPLVYKEQLSQYVQGCFAKDKQTQLRSTTYMRKLLSISDPPIQAIVDSGALPRLVQFLTFDHFEELQHQAVWAVGNITSGNTEHTAAVIKEGAVPIFVSLLDSTSNDVKEESLRSLSNIAGDNSDCSNLVLSCGVLDKLMPLFESVSGINIPTQLPLSLLQKATWAISNLSRGCPSQQYTQLILKALDIMLASKDEEILADSCWALSYLTDPQNSKQYVTQHIEMITGKKSDDNNIYRLLIDLLLHSSSHVRHPALRTIGNIVSNHEAAECVINSGVLVHLSKLFSTETHKTIKRELCWTLSNITAGSTDQIEAVIRADLIPPLIGELQSTSFEVSKEAVWAISNATVSGTDAQIQYLVANDAIDALCQFCIKSPGIGKSILVALEAIENILNAGSRLNASGLCYTVFSDIVRNCGGFGYFHEMVSGVDVPSAVKNKAISILNGFFHEKPEASTSANVVDGQKKFPVVSKDYVCFKCLAVGEHWIMHCDFVGI
eukprot:1165384_1